MRSCGAACGSGPLPRRDRAQFLSALRRRLHPAPCGRGMSLDDSALADIPVSQGAGQSAVQLRMHRHKPCLTALSRTHTKRRTGRIERQVPHFEVQGLRRLAAPPATVGASAASPSARRCADDRVNLVGFKVLRYAPLTFGG